MSGLGYNPCLYCDYACICGFEPGCEVKSIASIDSEDAYKRMEGDDGDGTQMDA